MSWSFSVGPHHSDHLGEALEVAAQQAKDTQTHAKEESAEQIDAACLAVIRLVMSGAVGNAEKQFHVSCWGHANHGHHMAQNWSNDLINITVSQASPVHHEKEATRAI